MKAVRVHEFGGPEVLVYEDAPDPVPGEGEALVKIGASGINYIDVYYRTGQYPAQPPFTAGQEAAGIVESVGAGVEGISAGDQVAYEGVLGSYAEYAVVPAHKLVPLPDGVNIHTAAAVLLQGMTAHYLTRDTYKIGQGDTALIHAAAGGVGLLLIQMVKQSGATAIGTVSTDAKAALAREAGADEVILYTEKDFEAETRRITDGRGVDVVYDSVGKSTFDKSLACLRPRGTLALFGQASGAVGPLDLQRLNSGGSLFVTRPSLVHHTLTREELLGRSKDVFDMVGSGMLNVRIDREYPLSAATEAHSRLEGRQSTGKLLLIP